VYHQGGIAALTLFSDNIFPISEKILLQNSPAHYPYSAVRLLQLKNYMKLNKNSDSPCCFENEYSYVHFAFLAFDGQGLKIEISHDPSYYNLFGTVQRYVHDEGLMACKNKTEAIEFIREAEVAKDVVAFVLMNPANSISVPVCNLYTDKKADRFKILQRILWVIQEVRTCKCCIDSAIQHKNFPIEYPRQNSCFVTLCKCDKKPFCVCPCDSCIKTNQKCEFIRTTVCICDGECTQAAAIGDLKQRQNQLFSKPSTVAADHGGAVRGADSAPRIAIEPELSSICGLYDIGHLLKTLRNALLNQVISCQKGLISSLMLLSLNDDDISETVVLNADKMSEGNFETYQTSCR
jgi:hypothetical protein